MYKVCVSEQFLKFLRYPDAIQEIQFGPADTNRVKSIIVTAP